MEPLTAGAIALAYLLLNKTFEKTGEIIVAKGFEQGGKVIELLKRKSPETASELEAAAEHPALPPGQPEDFGEAVLVEKIESAAKADPEIRAAVEALGNDAKEAAKVNPELEKAIKELTEAVKAQKITNIAKNNTGNVAVGGSVSIQAENFHQTF
jgi:uncharacterized membrane protein